MDLHFAEFQGSTSACCPFRLSVIGEITPPVLYGLRVLVVSLKSHGADNRPRLVSDLARPAGRKGCTMPPRKPATAVAETSIAL
jgi:hypothetical protein